MAHWKGTASMTGGSRTDVITELLRISFAPTEMARLSEEACAALGNPRYIRLYWDRTRRVIGLEGSPEETPAGSVLESNRTVDVSLLLEKAGVSVLEPVELHGQMEGERLVVEMTAPECYWHPE